MKKIKLLSVPFAAALLSSCNHKMVKSSKDVSALVGETYMYAAIVAVAALVLAFIIANMIKYQGGKNATDHIKRRVWYIIIGIIAPIAFFLFNSLYMTNFIADGKKSLASDFSTANIWATLVALGIYAVVGILLMVIMRSSKWGSILGKSKK
jgi:uncharacterized membrane protein